jgi:DNA polymerase phi
MDVFRNLSSADASIRAAATLTLVKELQEVQRAYEQGGSEGNDDGDLKLEAAKDGCLKNCAPTMRYAIRRLIRGISSSRAVSFPLS